MCLFLTIQQWGKKMTDLRPFKVGNLVMINPRIAKRLRLTQKQLLATILEVEPIGQENRKVRLECDSDTTVHAFTTDIVKATHDCNAM